MSEPTNIRSMRVARARHEASNKLVVVIEQELDAALVGADSGTMFVALCNGFVAQLVGALTATIDAGNDQTSGVATPALMRDFLRLTAAELESQGRDHRENGSSVAAGCCEVTATELRETAERLHEHAGFARDLLNVARGRG